MNGMIAVTVTVSVTSQPYYDIITERSEFREIQSVYQSIE